MNWTVVTSIVVALIVFEVIKIGLSLAYVAWRTFRKRRVRAQKMAEYEAALAKLQGGEQTDASI